MIPKKDVDMKKNRQCYACNYARTPANRDTCNYCGQAFDATDNIKKITDTKDPSFVGLPVQKLNTVKLPKDWYTSPDVLDFLECLKTGANKDDDLPRIYKISENAGSFYTVLTGSTGSGLQKFLDKHKELAIYNCYTDHYYQDHEEITHNPTGMFAIGFEKRVTPKTTRTRRK